ncbi:MAG: VC0807 family protein [Rubrobacter sp.]
MSINRPVKLVLDVLMGAVVPILVLSYLSDPLGAVPAYLISALIPAGWVLADLFLISERFNFITGFLGLNAIVRGLLAFWFVDGALYAFKDTVGSLLFVLVFGGSLLAGRPLLGAFVAQALDPRTPEQEASLERLFAERPVARTLFLGTAIVALVNVATALANFLLNLWIVTAPFGTGEFNFQVARVNAITRLTLGVPEFLAIGFAISLVIYSLNSRLYSRLPDPAERRGFWERVETQGKVPAAPRDDPERG